MLKDKKRKIHYQTIKSVLYVAAALIYMVLYMFLCNMGLGPVFCGVLLVGCYVFTVIVLEILYYFIVYRNIQISKEEQKAVSDITRELLIRLDMPVAICDGQGKIIWHNKLFSDIFGDENYFGRGVDALCGIDYHRLTGEQEKNSLACEIRDQFFTLYSYDVKIEQKDYNVLMFHDITALKAAYKRIDEEATQVAYIVIDNLSEILQFVHAKYRTVSAEIESILSGWAASVGGIFKEYERDKFIFLFHRIHLREFVDGKFDIINKIREIRIDEGGLPVTISIGVSGIEGSLSEKEKAARAALDMALQRGGDQAVVKYPTEMLFFGGKTKTIQKKTKVRARVFVNELTHAIRMSSRVLVMGHIRADMDSLGAALGIVKLARFCGVQTNMVADRSDPNTMRFFKKLSTMAGYENIVIDRAEALELNSSSCLLVVVDVNNRGNFESPDLFASVNKTVVIDHHITNDDYETTFSYIEPSASSTCEIVAELLEQALPEGNLTKDEADMILSGILLDTRQFTRNTGSRTFGAAQYLRDQGAVPSDAQKLYQSSFAEFAREARFQSKLKMYRDNLLIAVNDCEDNVMSDRIIGAKMADKLLELEQVSASFTVCRIDSDVYISARSGGQINVQIIMGYLGGGGSYNSSAAQIPGARLEDGVKKLKEAIDKYYSED
ncbi:MAG: hypothetical protein HFE78_03045 [Clostridiales bacterium]|nr:hypothetical protein [Clostridiales bacterium]